MLLFGCTAASLLALEIILLNNNNNNNNNFCKDCSGLSGKKVHEHLFSIYRSSS
jgi:hypothetical protein